MLSAYAGNINFFYSPASGVTTGTLLTAAYSGTETVTYQWKKDGVDVASGVSCTPAAAGSYTVTVSAPGYTGKTSGPVTVTSPAGGDQTLSGEITIRPASGLFTGTTLTAIYSYSGTETGLSYQWNKNGAHAASGGTGATYTPAEAGSYTVTVSAAGYQSKTSAAVTVTAPVPLAELPNHVARLPQNTAANPHTVKLDMVNISINGVMGSINTAVTNRYIIVDLSDCYATNQTISGSDGNSPGPNDMNVIRNNQYIVGIILPGELTTIGEGTFFMCSSLASVTIPGGVTSIRNHAFSRCANLRFTVTNAGEGPAYYSTLEDGKMLIKWGDTLEAYPSASGAVTLPEGLTSIWGYAFEGCSSLTNVTITAGVTSIGNGAFDGCSRLASVTFAPGSNISGEDFADNYYVSGNHYYTFPGDLRAKYLAGDVYAELRREYLDQAVRVVPGLWPGTRFDRGV